VAAALATRGKISDGCRRRGRANILESSCNRDCPTMAWSPAIRLLGLRSYIFFSKHMVFSKRTMDGLQLYTST
jgi:hypothetical protein